MLSCSSVVVLRQNDAQQILRMTTKSKGNYSCENQYKALVRPEGSAEDHDKDDGRGAEGQPAGVGANVSGLDAAGERAEAAGGSCGGSEPEPLTRPVSTRPPRKTRVNISSGVTKMAL